MHHLIWFLVVVPPCLAYCLWLGVRNRQGGYGRVRLGQYGYWILLVICYAAAFGAALAAHQI